MLNVRNRSMQNTNLFVLLLILSGRISSIHGQQALNWQIFSCQLFYDRNNVNINTDNTIICFSSPPMPCNCKDRVVYGDPLADGSAATTLHLTDNSYLHYTIRLHRPNGEYWSIQNGGLQFVWGPNADLAPDPESTVSIYDMNDQVWYPLSWFHTYNGVVPNLNALYINPAANIPQYTTFMIEFNLNWTYAGTGTVEPTYIVVNGRDITLQPTTDPSKSPSKSPTKSPSINPTTFPSKSPTGLPSASPTQHPTTYNPTHAPSQPPTYTFIRRKTRYRIGENSYFNYSNNIIDLNKERDMTYNSPYVLPDITKPNGQKVTGDNRPWKVTAILAWADIDASIELLGCPNTTYNYSSTNPEDPNSIYHCDTGTWLLKSSGRLADWQDTYGRFEIWEVDDQGTKWPHMQFEFNWINKTCFMIDDDVTTEVVETKDCPLLPLTGSLENAAYFEFTMPKRYGDARNAPLIAVWYDLLSVPYSIKPELGYEYLNMTLHEPAQGAQFGLEDAMVTFQPAIVASGILFACFLAVMLLSCFVSGSKKSKKDFMIDTRNLKTTFRHTPETIICPPSEIQNRARFSCARHGPWLLVVLVARLFYMFIFTFTFFYLVFQAINKPHYDTLGEYDYFAVGRDAQLVSYSKDIEIYYANETNRMEREVEKRNTHCHGQYINETWDRYATGSKAQFQNHSDQMDNPFGIDLNSTSKDIYVLGDGKTACNIKSSTDPTLRDAIIFVNSKTHPITYTPKYEIDLINTTTNETYTIAEYGNITTLLADGYDTSLPNFTEVESTVGEYCELATWCYGWGFFNKDGNEPPFYVMLSELGEPDIDANGASGICYGAINLAAELEFLRINSTNAFDLDVAEKLNQQYLEEFQSYAEDMYDTASGLWNALQNIDTGPYPAGFGNTVGFKPDEDLGHEAGYGIDVGWSHSSASGNTTSGTLEIQHVMDFGIRCQDCPQGNLTKESLLQAGQYFFNTSNLSDYTNLSDLPVNFSNLVSINTAFIEFPDFPTIELPFDFDFPLDLSLIFNISLTLDLLLLVYRWYRTTGIVARIVRGKDVEVGLSYLMVSQSEQKCCYGRSVMDYCLNCIIYCHDKLFRLSYNAWKLFFWVWFLLKIAIVALIVLMLYYLVY
eukprot:459572_1